MLWWDSLLYDPLRSRELLNSTVHLLSICSLTNYNYSINMKRPHELDYGDPEWVSGYLIRLNQIQARQRELSHLISILEIRLQLRQWTDPKTLIKQSRAELEVLLWSYKSSLNGLIEEEAWIQNKFYPQNPQEELPSLAQEFEAFVKAKGLR